MKSKVISLHEAELVKNLAAAGLKYLDIVTYSSALIPPQLASFANSIATDGQEWAVSIENDAPDFRERMNHEWYMLSAHQGLFAREHPQFLIAVRDVEDDHPNTSWWARVALEAEWDFAGAGAEARVTGCGWGHPEFVMLSIDGNVIVRGSQGQDWMDIVCLREPHRIPSLRKLGAKFAESNTITDQTRNALIRWLKSTSTE
ncbi:hypothetical protein [Streptomyces sp. AF1A]|jgi:hypothetical protein|uniref:hypothetical protein n=1 Tax=Streptomyces sp. AF1A TaxID=3394350 RepID=UPI0039BC4F0F